MGYHCCTTIYYLYYSYCFIISKVFKLKHHAKPMHSFLDKPVVFVTTWFNLHLTQTTALNGFCSSALSGYGEI